jgi:DNA repair protein RadC
VTSVRSVRALPAGERPRERLRRLGSSALSARELLALIVGSGGGRASALDVADAVLERVDGSLTQMAGLPSGSLERIPGVGRATASRLQAALELGRRAALEVAPHRPRIHGPDDVMRLLGPRLRDLRHEEFHALLLNAQHRVLRSVQVTRGILDASLVHPREVFKAAVVDSAAGVILVHNHPSGDPTPSLEDRAVTRQMASAGRALGIPVVDHVILGHARFVSLAAQGELRGSSPALSGTP